MKGSHKTLLIISQVYAPDPAAVGQHITDVAEEMSRRGWRVVVYTSARGYDEPSQRYRRREHRNGVEVRRLPLSSFGKRSIAIRLVAQGLFLIQAVFLGLWTGGLRLVLVSTSPPFASLGGSVISWLRSVPLVWWVMDLNPDQIIVAGKIGSRSLPARAFDWINRLTIAQARDVIVLDRFMQARVLAKLDRPGKVHIIPPWSPDEGIVEGSVQPNSFRDAHRLGAAFIVMYSGNHALQHPLDTLLDAAAILSSDSKVKFVFIGGGAGKRLVESRIHSGATNIISLPYQPLESLRVTLAAADVHAVTMGEDMVGIVHPCKVYGAMAAGRPILFFGPQLSHCGEILAAGSFGYCLRHGAVADAVSVIKRLMAMSDEERRLIGTAAATAARERYSKSKSLGDFCEILSRP